ncbi:MFS transporter [Paenarthrobacter nicotinovorans]|uniref:MFS transporter n=1 Tax=Paenarthrobacter nicotinovorans TaxID=29320 RepID=UPI00119D5F8A|nr:MFS transporter [Paenarthrobacter nicotinovorans]
MPAPAVSRTLVTEGAPRGGLAALCITQTTAWGVLYYALLTAAGPISEDTGWDQALVTGAFSAGLVVSAAAGIAVGRILDRTGPRNLMAAGSLIGVLAVALAGLSPNLIWFAAAWLLAGTAQAAVLYQPAFTVISRWYGPARIRPLTILTLVAGFASTIFAPLTAALCTGIGWRGAFLVLAGLLGAVTVPLHTRYLNQTWPQKPSAAQILEDAAQIRRIRRSREFLALQVLMVLLCLGLYTVTLNIIPLLMEKGADYTLAALGLGLVGAGQVAGRLLFAALPTKARIPAVTGTATLALLLLALPPGPVPLLIGAGMIAGAVRGCQTLLQATIVATNWGATGLGTLQGLFAAPLTIVTALAPALGPALATWCGSFTGMTYTLAAATGTALLISVAHTVRGRHVR